MEYQLLDLEEFGKLLDQISKGCASIYTSPDRVEMLRDVGARLGELLCDKSIGLSRPEQLLASICLVQAIVEITLRDMNLMAAPAKGVQ